MKKAKRDSIFSAKFLDEDLVEFCILPRLPAKSLIRFKCVSKKWHRIISTPSPRFILMQSQHAPSSLLFESFYAPRHTCISEDPPSVTIPSLSYPLNFYTKIVASCNGLCVLWYSDQVSSGKFYIGNPSLKDWNEFPHSWPYYRLRPSFCGLAVDVRESVQYKFVIAADFLIDNANIEYEFHIFSSNSGRWNVAGRIMTPEGGHPLFSKQGSAVYVMGNLYWTTWTIHRNVYALQFSLEEELSYFLSLPPGADVDGMIGECGGKLSYTIYKEEGEIQMWSMNDSFWTKRVSINLQNTIDTKPYTAAMKVVVLPFEGGFHFLFSVEETIYLYDILMGEIHKQPYERISEICFSYKNTIVPSH